MKKLFAVAKTFTTVKTIHHVHHIERCCLPRRKSSSRRSSVFRDKEKVVGNTSLEFATTRMLFAAAKRFATTKTAIRHSEERTYVSILVLSQTRFVSHSSQACKFFPQHTTINIYI